jgi:hypothetical protein
MCYPECLPSVARLANLLLHVLHSCPIALAAHITNAFLPGSLDSLSGAGAGGQTAGPALQPGGAKPGQQQQASAAAALQPLK